VELIELLRLTRRQAIACTAVVGAATAIGLASAAIQPAQHRTSAAITLDRIFELEDWQIADRQIDLRDTVRLPSVVDAAASRGMSAAEITGGVTVAQPSTDSSTVTLTLQGGNSVAVEPTLRLLVDAALTSLATDEIERTAAELAAAERNFATATASVREIGVFPNDDINSALGNLDGQITGLRAQVAATDDPATQAAIQIELDAKEAERAEIEALMPEYQPLRDAQQTAFQLAAAAQERATRAETALPAIEAGDGVEVTPAVALGRTRSLARGAAVGCTGALLGCGLALSVLNGRRHRAGAPAGPGRTPAPPRPEVWAPPTGRSGRSRAAGTDRRSV
jgi:hypothetical protein